MLRHAGLIVSERRGTSIVYSLNVSAFEEALGVVLDLFQGRKGRKGSKP